MLIVGTFNTGKGDLGITAIYDSGCIDYDYDYDYEEDLYNDVNYEIKAIPNRDNTFPYGVYYTLSDIFKIKIEPGYYNGFSLYIDSPYFSVNDMIEEIKTGLYNPNIDIKTIDNEDVKMEIFFQYIAEKVSGYIVDSTPEIEKDIKNIVKEYFNYLNYNIAKIGRDYGLYNLIQNGWCRKVEPFNDNIIQHLECRVG